MKIYKNTDNIWTRFFEITEGLSPPTIAQLIRDKSSELYWLKRLHRVHSRAYGRSGKWGYVGVGCISFAEQRMIQFQERVQRLSNKKTTMDKETNNAG